MSNDLYSKFRECGHAALFLQEVQSGSMFFALKVRQPREGWLRFAWRVWVWLELYAAWALALLEKLTRGLHSESPLRRNLRGHYNGNAYARQALAAGALYAVVDNPRKTGHPNIILVDDVPETLRTLARRHREKLDIPVIAITGSAGKSTTAKLIHDLLKSTYRSHLLGGINAGAPFPAAILNIPLDAEMVVAETASVGLRMLVGTCSVLKPTHGLITFIGEAHLNTMKDLDTIKKAKWELYDYLLNNGGQTYLSCDHPWLHTQADRLPNTWRFGSAPENRTRLEALASDPYLQVRLHDSVRGTSSDIPTQIAGHFNLVNIQAAVAVAQSLKVPEAAIIEALKSARPPKNRSEIIKWGSNTIFNDSVHSTLSGLRASLASFMQFPAERRLLILGDIPGGDIDTPDQQLELMTWIHALRADEVVYVGPSFNRMRRDEWGLFLPNVAAYRTWLADLTVENTLVYLKGGSHLVLMESLQAKIDVDAEQVQ